MKLGVITYDHPHLKTEQVLHGLSLQNFSEVRVYGLPFKPRAARKVLFNHRPDMAIGAHPRDVAKRFGYRWQAVVNDVAIPSACDVYLVGGAGILSPECVSGKKILNVHPGVIPAVRGLDAFKWAILEGQPIGNTLHWIDESVDGGEVLAVVETPVYVSDTLESLARRHYEIELFMTLRFKDFLGNPTNRFESLVERRARMRMPCSEEENLREAFGRLKAAHSKFSEYKPHSNI